MPEQSISCPSCGRKIPLTRALRAEIEESVTLRLEEDLQRAQKDAAKKAEKKFAQELVALRDQIKDPSARESVPAGTPSQPPDDCPS